MAAVASPDVIFKSPGAVEVPKGLNKFSQTVTQHKSQGASLAQLYGTGLRDEDRDKPQVVPPHLVDQTPRMTRCVGASCGCHMRAASLMRIQ